MIDQLHQQGIHIGCPSWIWPGDMLMNARRIMRQGMIDDVQLLLFESRQADSLPALEVIDELKSYREHLTYTVHLPVDVDLASDLAVELIGQFILRTSALEPKAYVLHAAHHDRTEFDKAWLQKIRDHLSIIIEQTGIGPEEISIENQSYDFEIIQPLIEELKLSVCFDVGHVLRYGYDWNEYVRCYLNKARVIHLQSFNAETQKDHRALDELDDTYLNDLMSFCLSDHSKVRVLTLEVFDEGKLSRSLDHLKCFLRDRELDHV